jgi:hypothetical protein
MILLVISCGKNSNQGLIIYNKSSEAIYYVSTFKDRIEFQDLEDINIKGEIYSIKDYQGTGKTKTDTSYKYRILPNENRQILGGGFLEYGFKGPSAQELINKNGGKVTIYVFTDSFLRNTPKFMIVTKQTSSKQYTYNTKDLEKLNWIITFKEYLLSENQI